MPQRPTVTVGEAMCPYCKNWIISGMDCHYSGMCSYNECPHCRRAFAVLRVEVWYTRKLSEEAEPLYLSGSEARGYSWRGNKAHPAALGLPDDWNR